ncbi:GAF domain-containing protein [bacterium]|nr:GAF domain-containing protein [bacterium]
MQPSYESPEFDPAVQAFSRDLLAMIDDAFLHEIQQAGLEAMVRLTGSRHGYFFVRSAAPARIRIHNVVAPGANTSPAVQEHDEDLDQTGFWSACLEAAAPVIRNEPSRCDAPLTAAFGTLRRDLAVPVHDDGKIVAVVGVGNRPSDYGPRDVEFLAELARRLWRVVLRKRLRDEVDPTG